MPKTRLFLNFFEFNYIFFKKLRLIFRILLTLHKLKTATIY